MTLHNHLIQSSVLLCVGRVASRITLGCTCVALAGCSNVFYAKTPTGTFTGKVDVEWIAPNRFIYRPHATDPLRFVTSDGRRIQPRTMYTDGGSIPRFFWSLPNYGPWDFAPGFIIHDWLFEQQHCREGDWQTYTFQRSAEILAEAIKTQMENSAEQDSLAVWAIYQGVKTPIAERLWSSGECKPPPPASLPPAVAAGAPIPPGTPVRILTIDTAVRRP